MMGLSRCFTDWAARKLAFAALVVQSARTAMVARATPAGDGGEGRAGGEDEITR